MTSKDHASSLDDATPAIGRATSGASPRAASSIDSHANDVPATAGGRRGPAWLRGRWPATVVAAATNIGLFMVLFQLYKTVRKQFIQQDNSEAFANAEQIIRWEERLGLYFEVDLQRWTIEHEWIIRSLNWYYAAFMWVFYGCCVLAIILVPVRYRPLRRVFLCSMLLALPWYAIYPLAPPRFMTGEGFVDTLAIYGPVYFKEGSDGGGLVTANRFAAMPSMHIGWSTIGALMLAVTIPSWRRIPLGLLLGLFHVSMMTITVMATGNHYWLDAVGGWLIVLGALALARVLPGWQPPWRLRRGFVPGAAAITRP